MSNTGMPEKGGHMEQLWGVPRRLAPGKEVNTFDDQTHREDKKQLGRILTRRDELVVPDMPTAVFSVLWRSYHTSAMRGNHVVNLFDPGIAYNPSLKTTKIFSAVINLDPEMREQLWADNEGQFVQSPYSIAAGETPKAEYLKLVLWQLAHCLKLELNIPTAVYVARPESEHGPVTFSAFQAYGRELFGDNKIYGLYIPDNTDPGVIRTKLLYDDPTFSYDGLQPLAGGIPDRPLVNA